MTSTTHAADDDFRQRLTYMIRRLGTALGQRVDRALVEFSLTGTQLGALSHLSLVAPEGLSGAQLAQRNGVTPQSMSAAIADLVERCLVRRTPHPVHGRILEVRITPDGIELRDRAQAAMAELNADIVASMDPELRRQLVEGLGQLVTSLGLEVADQGRRR